MTEREPNKPSNSEYVDIEGIMERSRSSAIELNRYIFRHYIEQVSEEIE